MATSQSGQTVLNGICPYFTMFPLSFPLNVLKRRARKGQYVLDPFCGRGTTNYAARLVGLGSVGVDSSPVAVAITASKLVSTTADEVIMAAREILAGNPPDQAPQGEFWNWAYHPSVLDALCRFRRAFMEDCTTAPRIALRGVILGALHGPRQKTFPSYFSNQCPRTYAPKPAYASRYWSERGLVPEEVDVLAVIERRARRYYGCLPPAAGIVRHADSRHQDALQPPAPNAQYHWVITSPPYYGMRTYIPDQWLRNWFLGGPETVDYSNRGQVIHSSPETFSTSLRLVWRNAADVCAGDARMIIRFGGITDRHVEPRELIRLSLADSGWRITTMRAAGTATEGKRQAEAFLRTQTAPMAEYDVWTCRT